MIDYELRAMMPDTVTLELPADRDEFSKLSYSPPSSYQCRIELKATLVRDQDGREVVSSTTIYLATTVEITHEARVTLPNGKSPSIVAIESVRDENGAYVTKIFT